jgi:Zn-dependent membrane protease YugP
MLGVFLYGAAFLFTVVTLPVEFNASRRAKAMLRDEGILTDEEMDGARKVLSAAAMTYLAGMFTSLVYFLRFMFFVTTMFGRRRD